MGYFDAPMHMGPAQRAEWRRMQAQCGAAFDMGRAAEEARGALEQVWRLVEQVDSSLCDEPERTQIDFLAGQIRGVIKRVWNASHSL
jgi:hypothetical protein